MADLADIRAAITQARKRMRLRQADLAERARVSLTTVQMLEQGRAGEIGFSKLSRILAVLGLELRLAPAASVRPTLDDLRSEDRDD
jgi:transcriptional regulator with XRE-family HTH domain